MPPTSCARLREARALAALGLAAGITVPAALLGGPQAAALPAAPAASLAADEQPGCGDPAAKDFPIEARIQGAPDRYASGGGYGTWFLDLTNTTDTSCKALHPVLVLADRDRRLTSDQIQLEFSEPGSPGTEHRVTWESTDRDEQIGVFGEEGEQGGRSDPFLGFTVPAGETVSVRVRMAFTSDTAPGPVTAHAAVVQRRHQDRTRGGGREDGEWVGESEKYPFVIVDGATGGIREPDGPRTEHPRTERPRPEDSRSERPDPERTGSGDGTRTERPGDSDGSRTDPGTGRNPSPDRDSGAGESPDRDSGAGEEDSGGEESPGLPPRDGLGRPLPELARTGPASIAWTGAAAGVLLLAGAGLLRHARRVRRNA
ncbi:peptidase [Streptomyces sp. JUS-F4]|uniref:peptidase n=1 Tax=Streptomyces sp. JUS-F4 TaxID=2951988 RepID=UPI002666ECD8|nr:peptidase [Streptomyces sp. JUS-F4]WKN14932.1 peptidase [Streptomyces sp. JUS-F4]